MPDDETKIPPLESAEDSSIDEGTLTLSPEEPGRLSETADLEPELEDLQADMQAVLVHTPEQPDQHSLALGPVDTHSVRTDAPVAQQVAAVPVVQPVAPAPAPKATAPAATTAPVPVAAGPVVGATVQATQAAVSTAKQAGQQVTAAVQNKAQKITVAPRKAIYRGRRFMAVYGGLVGVAGVMAIMARRYRYFPADVGITRALQKPTSKVYEGLMTAVSQLGWRWISVGTRASAATLMWAAGFRMESAFTVSTWSGDVLTVLIKHPVDRPRPTKDLVRVMSSLTENSFPSGHVVHYVTFYGFLFYLVFIHLKQRWFRTALLTLLAGVILLVGPSRVYMGHHWPSDVTGAYLVGTLWLGLLIIAYLETKANYTLHTHPPFFVKRPAQLT